MLGSEPETLPAPEGMVPIALRWRSSDDLPTLYSNQLLISHSGGEFYLVFGEVLLPLNLATETIPDQLDVRPVARIVIRPENLEEFLKALQTNFERFKGRTAGLKGDDENGS